MLVLREQAIIPKHNDTSQALQQLALLDLFFFFWQRSHNSGIYAKIIKQRLPLKVPIHHASPPILPFLRLTTCQPACTHVCSKVFAMLLQLLCRLPGRGDSLLTTKNASSGLEVAENILTYWQRHHRVRIVMLRT